MRSVTWIRKNGLAICSALIFGGVAFAAGDSTTLTNQIVVTRTVKGWKECGVGIERIRRRAYLTVCATNAAGVIQLETETTLNVGENQSDVFGWGVDNASVPKQCTLKVSDFVSINSTGVHFATRAAIAQCFGGT